MGTPVRSAREMGKYMLIIFLFIGLALCDEEDPGSRRKPKLLLVTTATSTTSLTTNTNCYIATAVLGPPTCRRTRQASSLRPVDQWLILKTASWRVVTPSSLT